MTRMDGKMERRGMLLRSAKVICVVAALTSGPGAKAFAQTVYGCPTCQANVQFFGHYPTRWRPWPGETRPDIHFPQSIGAEPIKRPAGETPPVLPHEKLEPIIPKPGQAFPEPAPLEPAVPPPDLPGRVGPGEMQNQHIPPGGTGVPAPMNEANLPPGSPFQTEPPPTPPPPQSQGLPSSGAQPPVPVPQGAPPSPAPAPAVPPTPSGSSDGNSSVMLPDGPALSARIPASGETALLPPATTQILLPSQRTSTPLANVTPGAPLVVKNPTVTTALTPNPSPRIDPTPDKLAVSRVPALPGRILGPSTTPLPQSQFLPEPQPSPPGFPVAASVNSPPAVSDTVWAEDSSPTQSISPAGYVTASGSPSPGVAPARPTASAPESPLHSTTPALGGYCPVELVENETWMKGEERFAVEHRGQVYYCAGAAQKRKFQTNPERYAPVLDGKDPVVFFDQGVRVDGKIEHCVVYDGRLYMFSGIQSLARFRQNPQRYAQLALRASQ
ncbi:hypothetical protein [Thermogutta sp.]|uniref:hypothetical protein n=1 Tax=Thermogutta sp. TaxID=1962930 RepID=UPI00321F8645